MYLASASVTPIVFKQGSETYRLVFSVTDSNIVSVRLQTPFPWFAYRGAGVDSITLYDDGTHGDATPGDKVFTIDELSFLPDEERAPVRAHMMQSVDITFVFADGSETRATEDVYVKIQSIDPSIVEIPAAVRLDSDIQMTRHVVNLVTRLEGEFPNFDVSLTAVARRYYEFFADDRDFLIIAKPFNTGEAAGGYTAVRNDVEGIGLSSFDSSSSYGSSGILQGVISFNHPSIGSFRILNHELLHRWAVFLDASLELRSAVHWGPVQMQSSGFGTTFAFSHIEQISDSTFRTWKGPSFDGKYNKLELYLMGLADIDDVDFPLRTLAGRHFQRFEEQDGVQYTIWKADSVREVTQAEFLSVQGARRPAYPETQREFTAAMIVVYDRLLTDTELAFYDYLMKEYERPALEFGPLDSPRFYAATLGKGSLSTSLAASLASVAQERRLPGTFVLNQNYPNPFNAVTTISYSLPVASHVELIVYDALGRRQATLIDGQQPAGEHQVAFDATGLPSGIYFYTLTTPSATQTRKLVLLK